MIWCEDVCGMAGVCCWVLHQMICCKMWSWISVEMDLVAEAVRCWKAACRQLPIYRRWTSVTMVSQLKQGGRENWASGVSQKSCCTLIHNFTKCWLFFSILLLCDISITLSSGIHHAVIMMLVYFVIYSVSYDRRCPMACFCVTCVSALCMFACYFIFITIASLLKGKERKKRVFI